MTSSDRPPLLSSGLPSAAFAVWSQMSSSKAMSADGEADPPGGRAGVIRCPWEALPRAGYRALVLWGPISVPGSVSSPLGHGWHSLPATTLLLTVTNIQGCARAVTLLSSEE